MAEHNSKTRYVLVYALNVLLFGADDEASISCVIGSENSLGSPAGMRPADPDDSPLWSVNFACVVGPTSEAKGDVAIFGHGAIWRTVLADQARRMKKGFEDKR